ncbi:hypothetical protein QVD17_34470 [Tagetes erecta]|uniref:Leucine-rich repeat-containing N-terminal plant-type domain-containing protein n=1 Tax=Tagetes erecta TaxID=13708 RepID=A0AAD8JZX8_TARER|nr:hypothetical protein QVD17_34470 [Tagetes erecta]
MKNLSIFIISILLIILICLPTPSLSKQNACNKNDEKTLLNIKKSLGNPNILASWHKTLDCCQWDGIYCTLNTGRVTDVNIFSASDNISAQFPPEIGDLPYLQNLALINLTNLYGQIPSSFTKLTRLNSLAITSTSLSGPIPSFLSELKNLMFLDLSYNKFTGSIPESLGWFNRQVLYLSNNRLTGNVPKSLGYVNFTKVDFSENQLTGDLSMFFGSNKTIRVAHFFRNHFQFNLSEVDELPESLWDLQLDHNKIYGSLSAAFASESLQYLNVSYNRLCGKIPQGLQKADETSFFHNRCLCGSPLPACS